MKLEDDRLVGFDRAQCVQELFDGDCLARAERVLPFEPRAEELCGLISDI